MKKNIFLLFYLTITIANAQNNPIKRGEIMGGFYTRVSDYSYPSKLPAFGIEATYFVHRRVGIQVNWSSVFGIDTIMYRRIGVNPKIISAGLFDNQVYITNGLELGLQKNENKINQQIWYGEILFAGFSTGLLFKPKILRSVSFDINIISIGRRSYRTNATNYQDKNISLLSPKLSINYCFSL